MMFNFSTTPAVCGHRGVPAVARENTLLSFETARDRGATWIEFDVRPTADRQLVVHHDPVTAEGFHIGSTRAADLPSYIPSLNEVVASFADLVLDVELKTDDTDLDAASYVALACEEIQALAIKHAQASMLVTSFDAEVLQAFGSATSDIATGYLYYVETWAYSDAARDRANRDALAHAREVGHQAIVPHHRLVTADLVSAAHGLGLHVATWTVNTATEARRCAQAGVDVIIGDDPQVILEGLD